MPLTQGLIVDTAIGIADRDGFDAVTLRRIAAELDVHVTSLYNHIATREAVTDGIVAALVANAELPVGPIGWERWVRGFVAAIGDIAESHPGAFAGLQLRPVQGAAASVSAEAGLAAFADAGLEPADAYSAVKATTLLAIAIGIEKAASSRDGLAETSVGDLPRDAFPQLHELSEVALDEQAAWTFSVEALVSGLRAQLRTHRTGKPRRTQAAARRS